MQKRNPCYDLKRNAMTWPCHLYVIYVCMCMCIYKYIHIHLYTHGITIVVLPSPDPPFGPLLESVRAVQVWSVWPGFRSTGFAANVVTRTPRYAKLVWKNGQSWVFWVIWQADGMLNYNMDIWYMFVYRERERDTLWIHSVHIAV